MIFIVKTHSYLDLWQKLYPRNTIISTKKHKKSRQRSFNREWQGQLKWKNDRTVTIETLGKPQVFTLYVDNQVNGNDA